MKKEKKTKKPEKCLCPYCEEEVITDCPFCKACGAALSYCVSCQIIVTDKETSACPECGAPLSKGRKER
jgi:predicted RNA-binding Zn-ribbon protein involved in translation (DUF1610 family)